MFGHKFFEPWFPDRSSFHFSFNRTSILFNLPFLSSSGRTKSPPLMGRLVETNHREKNSNSTNLMV
ncbi:MAG TPA: hypothetical protein DCR93_26390 [Cytophagales bacterium]|nr:hypothetical protein [Cytophagales bacterium]HAP62874.1 hypothetical protein [Cytophagales bacterium]